MSTAERLDNIAEAAAEICGTYETKLNDISSAVVEAKTATTVKALGFCLGGGG